jgi:two-component system NarL family response regulator
VTATFRPVDPFARTDRATLAISVAVIHGNRLAREGISDRLNQLPGIHVVMGARSADAAILRATNPQVVLMDLAPGRGSNVRLAEKVKRAIPGTHVIVMDIPPGHEDVVRFIDAGVSGFTLQDATLDDLANAIRSVAQGAHVLPSEMATTLFSQIADDAVHPRRSATSAHITPREREVINVIAEGLDNKEIAARLRITTDTVKSHVRNIMEKLMLHTRLQIAAYAHRESNM